MTASAADAPAAERAPLIEVAGLTLALPDGTGVVTEAALTVAPGQVVSLLGPSGAGKSTLVRALLAPEELRARGYTVRFAKCEVRAEPAWVPQRGALLDHLDVAGNIALAQVANDRPVDVQPWLTAVGMDGSFAREGRSVGALSGGQAQRVAVARTLAAGRNILILDEPSVGLDPLGVRLLAQFLHDQARARGVAVLVITHDLALAGGASDKIVFLDPGEQKLVPVELPEWDGPVELKEASTRARLLAQLEHHVGKLLAGVKLQPGGTGHAGREPRGVGPLRVLGIGLVRTLSPRLLGASATVFRRAMVQALLRPVFFYALVGALLGFTVPYVIAHLSPDIRPAAALRLVGGTYILALGPPLSAILFAATSGNAVNAWLGGLQLNRQVLALQGLGVAPERYLWAPSFSALALSYVATALVFMVAMVVGGYVLFAQYHVPQSFAVLTSDFLAPPPSRVSYLVRGIWLIGCYSLALAAIVVSRAAKPKDRTDQVTAAMTSSVVRCTSFVVVMELVSVVAVFLWTGK
jgi:ABC-type nitrate/sulfonate/bicarbonate transport system ATPase subunit/ABC-type transporter Mla maintaining outer membrane lipid asymmetry permease subunit MlaE